MSLFKIHFIIFGYGIENFRGIAKLRLAKFVGSIVPPYTCISKNINPVSTIGVTTYMRYA